jgi:cytoskeletal protein RodZ
VVAAVLVLETPVSGIPAMVKPPVEIMQQTENQAKEVAVHVTVAMVVKVTETVAKATETAAKSTEMGAKVTETGAKATETAAKATETAVKATEMAAKVTETAAKAAVTTVKATKMAVKATEMAAKATETATSDHDGGNVDHSGGDGNNDGGDDSCDDGSDLTGEVGESAGGEIIKGRFGSSSWSVRCSSSQQRFRVFFVGGGAVREGVLDEDGGDTGRCGRNIGVAMTGSV